MISTLRRRFIAVAMASCIAVLSVLLTAINISNYHSAISKADELLEIIAENHGQFPEDMENQQSDDHSPAPPKGKPDKAKKEPRDHKKLSPEAPFTTRYFTVTLDDNGKVLMVDIERISAITEDEATQMVQPLYEKSKTLGFVGRYRYKQIEQDGEILYIFLSCESQLASFTSFLWISIAISAAGLILIFVLVVFFSHLAMKPVAENYRKQKQFITDAGHELKTPLTIIDANTEVLEMMNGENEWTASIRNQVERLSDFTQKMVVLSRMEEDKPRLVMSDFSLSDAVEEVVQPFVPLAQSKGKNLTLTVENGLSYHGDETALRRMVSLLTDNAIQYSSPQATIALQLKANGKRRILTVTNPIQQPPAENPERWFERFYRADSSRNSASGGHGIGLSTVKAIVQAHKGKVSAVYQDGQIIFTVIL